MPVIEKIIYPRRNRVSFEVQKEYSRHACKVIIFPVETQKKQKYDFSDIVGKLHWRGDAIKAQRALRDEW